MCEEQIKKDTVRKLKGHMTDEEYVEMMEIFHSGDSRFIYPKCPFCQSEGTNLPTLHQESVRRPNGVEAARYLRCANCGAMYKEKYKLVGYEPLKSQPRDVKL